MVTIRNVSGLDQNHGTGDQNHLAVVAAGVTDQGLGIVAGETEVGEETDLGIGIVVEVAETLRAGEAEANHIDLGHLTTK